MILKELLLLKEAADLTDLEAKIIDAVLPRIKKSVEQYHDRIADVIDNGGIDDYLYDEIGKLTKGTEWSKDHDRLETKLKKMRAKAWEAAFAAKYNTTDKELIKGLEKKGEEKFSADELKFLKDLGSRLTTRVTIQDFNKENEYRLKFYMKSPEKLVIQAPNIVGQVYTDQSLASFNMSIAKVTAMFERFGLKAGKRPVHKRSAPSYYD